MKNFTKIALLGLVSLAFTTVFTSCNNDEEVVSPSLLVGTWMHNDKHDRDYEYIRFADDGTGEKWEVPHNAPSAFKPLHEIFYYTLQAGKITFIEPDGDQDVERLQVVNDNQIKIDRETYNRQ